MKPARFPIVLAVLALSACAAAPETYKPAAGLTPEAGAWVTGSNEVSQPSGYRTRIVVNQIDGKATEASQSIFLEWDAKELLTPGPHVMSLHMELVKWPVRAGIAELPIEARAGESYTIRGWASPEAENGSMRIDLWAETPDGERCSPVVTVPLDVPQSPVLVVPGSKSSPMMILNRQPG